MRLNKAFDLIESEICCQPSGRSGSVRWKKAKKYMFPGVTEVSMTQWRNSKDWKKTLNYTRTTIIQTNNSFGNCKKHPNIFGGVCKVSFYPSPRLLFFLLLWFGVVSQTNDSVSKYNSMTFQGLYPPQKLKGAWHGESECGRKMFGKSLSVFAPALTLPRTFARVCKCQEPIIIVIGSCKSPLL